MRRGVSLTLLAAASFVVVVVGDGHSVSACSCVGFSDDEAFDAADTVFTGTLVEIMTPRGHTFSSSDPERFVFDVAHVYKGDAFVRQTIITARDGASCGLEISGAGPFLVFATRTDSGVTGEGEGEGEGELYSNLCSGTRTTAYGPVPAAFGASHLPQAVPPGDNAGSRVDAVGLSRDHSNDALPYWVLGAFAGVAVGVAGKLLVGRRPRNAGG